MLKKLQYLVMLTALLMLGGLAGCASKSEEDTKITDSVNAKFSAEPTLSPVLTVITVDTNEGVVTLIGTVETPTQEQKAKELAGSVEGVKRVDSTLKVQPKETTTTTSTTSTTTTTKPDTSAPATNETSPAAPQQQY